MPHWPGRATGNRGARPVPLSPGRPGTPPAVSFPAAATGTLGAMADLRAALASTDGLRQARKPPGLRAATGPESCASCRWWKAKDAMSGQGACRLYAGYPTRADQVSNAYQPRRS